LTARASQARTLLSPAEIEALYEALFAARPEPKTELHYTDPFTLLVAVVLSAQATDAGVNRATPALFAAAPTPEAMLALGEEGVAAHIRSIGLFRTKAKNLVALSRALVEEHGGRVPGTREALQALPGVGRKTANVVLNTAFGEPVIAVDTHIFRVANRTGLAPGATVEAVEAELTRVTPPRFLLYAHHALILHGRYVCKARKPACPSCPIRGICRFPGKTVAPSTPSEREAAHRS